MIFKYIWKENTNFDYKWQNYKFYEWENKEVPCDNDKEFIPFLLRNNFIELKSVETELKTESETEVIKPKKK